MRLVGGDRTAFVKGLVIRMVDAIDVTDGAGNAIQINPYDERKKNNSTYLSDSNGEIQIEFLDERTDFDVEGLPWLVSNRPTST